MYPTAGVIVQDVVAVITSPIKPSSKYNLTVVLATAAANVPETLVAASAIGEVIVGQTVFVAKVAAVAEASLVPHAVV